MSMIGNLLKVSPQELESFLADSSLLENKIYDEENPTVVDIDKAWDGIIFLLTGQSLANAEHELVQVLFSGQLVEEDQDLGYGPAHYLTPEQVVNLNETLAGITVDELRKNYNPEKMTEEEVYPTIWDEGDDAFGYLSDNFLQVQELYAEAAKNGDAIITFLN